MSTRTCWSCRAEVSAVDPLCPACGKVQPPLPAGAQIDKFALLGFEPSFDAPAGLDDKFRALSRKLHPDRFARASPQERRFSLEQTTLLNDAYKTLRDPVRRAEHFLQLRGVTGEPKMSPEFLEETLERREELLEAKLAGRPLDALVAEAQRKRDEAFAQTRQLVAAGDLTQAAERLARLKYYARYLDEAAGKAEM